MNVRIIASLVFVLLALAGNTQNNTSSPYSVFGIGDLQNVAYGRNLAIGGVGQGIRDPQTLNLKNPASLTAIDSLSVLFEMGTFLKITQNSNPETSNYFKDGNLTHMSMGHRFNSRLYGGFGIMPLSNIGYNFKTIKSLEGEDSPVVTNWIGSGGINRVYYALGLKLFKNFSLGGEASYVYGPINESRTTITGVQSDNPTVYSTNTRYHSVLFKGAFQFNTKLDKKGSHLVLGATFSPSTKLTGNSFVNIQQSYGTSVSLSVFNEEVRATPIYYPMNYGAGTSLTVKGKYLFAADYERSDWSMNSSRLYKDQNIYSFGLERVPQNERKFFERCSYRVGFRYDDGYFTAKDRAIDDLRFTAGMGFPLRNSLSTINVSLEAGQRGTTSMGLIRERYSKISVVFSFHDYWFIKRKIN